jgi:hypothetical protein
MTITLRDLAIRDFCRINGKTIMGWTREQTRTFYEGMYASAEPRFKVRAMNLL